MITAIRHVRIRSILACLAVFIGGFALGGTGRPGSIVYRSPVRYQIHYVGRPHRRHHNGPIPVTRVTGAEPHLLKGVEPSGCRTLTEAVEHKCGPGS